MAQIKLRHPRFEGLVYGPNGEIQFGLRGGHAPGIAVVDEDDPLLPALFRDEPEIEVVTEVKAAVVYVCSEHPGEEYRSKQALAAHMKREHTPEPPAEAKPEE